MESLKQPLVLGLIAVVIAALLLFAWYATNTRTSYPNQDAPDPTISAVEDANQQAAATESPFIDAPPADLLPATPSVLPAL